MCYKVGAESPPTVRGRFECGAAGPAASRPDFSATSLETMKKSSSEIPTGHVLAENSTPHTTETNVGLGRLQASLRDDTVVALLEGVSDGVCVLDLDGTVRRFNTSAEILTGRPVGDVMGRPCAEAFGCGAPNQCPVRQAGPGRTWTERSCRGRRADGRELSLRVRSRSLVDPVGRACGYILVFSEHSLHESLQKRLAAYERLASIGELATSLVHEIGNPVSVILGFAHLLIQQDGGDPDGEIRGRIYREAERCRGIVGGLLDYARSSRRSPHPIPLNVGEVVAETAELLSYLMRRRNVTCEVHWAPDTPFAEADPGEMKQVFLNVMLNALDAMEQGGSIRVTGRLIEKEHIVGGDSLLRPVSRFVRDPWVEVRVEDEGTGLEPAEAQHVFEPFYSTKENGGGLGLTVCRRILQERGGSIRLENREGPGACVVLELPASAHGTSGSAPQTPYGHFR